MSQVSNFAWESAYRRGVQNLRNGVYDDTLAAFVARIDAASQYLVNKGVMHFSYDRDFTGAWLHKSSQNAGE